MEKYESSPFLVSRIVGSQGTIRVSALYIIRSTSIFITAEKVILETSAGHLHFDRSQQTSVVVKMSGLANETKNVTLDDR
jgi:hypothetical protein